VLLRRLARLPFLAVRQVRWWRGSWSKDSDRAYHEQLYDAQRYDPFRPDYPGYITIRRFADHVEPLLPLPLPPPAGAASAGAMSAPGAGGGTQAVLDVGCGPGEITCELARRHPGLSFVGIDHSEHAIARARENAQALGLSNIRFLVGDAEQLPPGERYALVTMFDAFHHLERPREFLAWLAARTTRCVLIEPAGTWTGRWARGADVDWLLSDLANIRDRLEAVCGDGDSIRDGDRGGASDGGMTKAGEQPVSAASAAGAGGVTGRAGGAGHGDQVGGSVVGGEPGRHAQAMQLAQGEGAVERRYALEDFQQFFAGWHLRITGTVAGFDRYPPNPYARSPLRAATGELGYALVRATEDRLLQQDRDGAAKHWVIAATTEAGVIEPRLPTIASVPEAGDLPPRRVASAFDVRYKDCDAPTDVTAGAQFRVTLEVMNAGWDEWRSEGVHPVRVSYHWLLLRTGAMTIHDGVRTDLPRLVGPGDACRVFVTVSAPPEPGDYVLAMDLVKEGVTWFSDAGMPWHAVRIRVTGR
jgi:SAM-dependent methyltransferase